MKNSVMQFLESPANRAGVSAWIATALTALMQWIVTQSPPPLDDLLGLVIGLIAVIQPDNSVTKGQVETLISDLQLALRHPDLASGGQVLTDVTTVASSIAHPSPHS